MVRWVAEALTIYPHRIQFRQGDELSWTGITIRSLWPRGVFGTSLNDNSLVIEVTIGSHRALLMGDVGDRVEQELINSNLLQAPYRIVVAGHHGSKGTSGDTFLSRLKPVYSIISTNVDNIRGYPSEETVKRLQRHSSKGLYITYENGDICLEWASIRGPLLPCSKKLP